MKKLKYLIAAVTLIAVVVIPFVWVNTAAAVDVITPICKNVSGEVPTVCKEAQAAGNNNPLLGESGVLVIAVRILSIIVGVSAVIVIIISGLKIIYSNGDSSALATARKQIIYALVGIAVAATASAVVSLILKRISG